MCYTYLAMNSKKYDNLRSYSRSKYSDKNNIQNNPTKKTVQATLKIEELIYQNEPIVIPIMFDDCEKIIELDVKIEKICLKDRKVDLSKIEGDGNLIN
jgi:hypothetical protein